jgi:hypothetical protein
MAARGRGSFSAQRTQNLEKRALFKYPLNMKNLKRTKLLHTLSAILFLAAIFTSSGCDRTVPRIPTPKPTVKTAPQPRGTLPASPSAPPLVAAARCQIGKTVYYDPAYVDRATLFL